MKTEGKKMGYNKPFSVSKMLRKEYLKGYHSGYEAGKKKLKGRPLMQINNLEIQSVIYGGKEHICIGYDFRKKEIILKEK